MSSYNDETFGPWLAIGGNHGSDEFARDNDVVECGVCDAYKNNLTGTAWLTLTNFMVATSSYSISDLPTGTNAARFYRVIGMPAN